MATGSFGISPSDLAFLGRLTVVSTHQRFSTFGLFATALVRTATPVPTHLTPSARGVLAGSRDFLRLRALAIPRRGRGAGRSRATILRMNRSAFDSASVQKR